MSSNEEQPSSRLDAIDQERKRQQKIAESMDWRSSNNNRMEDFDSNFKMYREIKNTSIPSSLQDISREDANRRGLSEQERQSRNKDFAIRRRRGPIKQEITMMNSNNTNIKQDLYKQQEKIIEELREENARLLTTITEYEQKIDYLRDCTGRIP